MPHSPKTALSIGALSLMLTLCACKQVDAEDENSISIETDGEERSISISTSGDKDSSASAASTSISTSTDGNDAVALSISKDGFNLDIDVPIDDLLTEHGAGESDGLYPGSNVTNVNINSDSNNGVTNNNVRIDFVSPADKDAVADWMMKHIREDGGTAKRSGDTIQASNDDGKSFTVKLATAGQKTKGRMVITDID